MAFFSFSLLKKAFDYNSIQIQPNQKYYSKDIALCKALNNRNKTIDFCHIKYEKRISSNNTGRDILFCLPPKFGLGDSIEYCVAIKSLIKSKKFNKVGVAFCDTHSYIFKNLFLLSNVYPLIISEEEIKKYDNVFHITLEIKSLKFQKYKRSDIAEEICKHFGITCIDFKLNQSFKTSNYRKTISVFPLSTSTIRTLPFKVINEIIKNFENDYKIKIFIDDSHISKNFQAYNTNNNIMFKKPKNVEELILEISKTYFGVFVDSGPLHLAKIFNKNGVLIETSVDTKILLRNAKNIFSVKNLYKSNYCNGPCGLVDIFAFENNIGCYETHKIDFAKIKSLKSYKNLQRWNKKENNSHFILNPVECIKKIDIKNIIELIKVKLKEIK